MKQGTGRWSLRTEPCRPLLGRGTGVSELGAHPQGRSRAGGERSLPHSYAQPQHPGVLGQLQSGVPAELALNPCEVGAGSSPAAQVWKLPLRELKPWTRGLFREPFSRRGRGPSILGNALLCPEDAQMEEFQTSCWMGREMGQEVCPGYPNTQVCVRQMCHLGEQPWPTHHTYTHSQNLWASHFWLLHSEFRHHPAQCPGTKQGLTFLRGQA